MYTLINNISRVDYQNMPRFLFLLQYEKTSDSRMKPKGKQVVNHSSQGEEICLVTWIYTKKYQGRNKTSVVSTGASLEMVDLYDMLRLLKIRVLFDILIMVLVYQHISTVVQDYRGLPKERTSI